ncbi:unnamed protein product [Staurois parvus]|uniref:Uncharacterized protein n=1 Tax=Staurois parvus TaxID=386267 RepID=A0ABN9BSM3_9NEOB|nr:unnamed protein product [Staurois parvus]
MRPVTELDPDRTWVFPLDSCFPVQTPSMDTPTDHTGNRQHQTLLKTGSQLLYF